MASFIAALWTRNTSGDPSHCQKPVNIKYYELVNALVQCQAQVNNRFGDLSTTNEFQAVFAAPEYYFTGVGNIRVPMPEAAKVSLEHSLLHLSQRFPKILIIPGSVYYAKPLTLAANSLKLDRQTGQLVQTTGLKDRREKTINKLTQAGLRELNQEGAGDTGLGNFLVFKEGGVGLGHLSNRLVPSIMDKQDAISAGNPVVLRNTTYLYLNGRRYGKYDKQTDFHESTLAPDQMVFLPGTADQCPQVGRHRFGVEICADHAMSRLRKRNPVGLDFHVVVSDSIANAPAAMAMARYGYFLHASSADSETAVVYRDDAGTLINRTDDDNYWFDYRSLGGGKLNFWCLPLPNDLRTEEMARNAVQRTQQAGMNRARQRNGV